jgi:protein deglycase
VALLLQATCYPSFMEKFTAEVIPVNSRVVADRNVVTSQGPGTAIEFALALVELLYGKEKMEEVAGPLVSCNLQHLFCFLLLC